MFLIFIKVMYLNIFLLIFKLVDNLKQNKKNQIKMLIIGLHDLIKTNFYESNGIGHFS